MKRIYARVATTVVATIGVLLVALPASAAQPAPESPSVGGPEGLVIGLIVGGLIGLIIFVDVFTGDGPEAMPELPREH